MVKLNYDIKDIYAWPLKAQALLLALFSLLLLYFGYLIDLSILRREIQASYQQENDLKLQFKKILEQKISPQNEIAQIPALKKLLSQWQAKIIVESELTATLDQILKLGSQDQLKFNKFEPENEITAGIYKKTPVKANVAGTYNQIASFISQLANFPKLIQLNDLTISHIMTADASSEIATSGPNIPLVAEINFDIYRK